MKTPLLCIHGINDDGAWAERLRPIFACDFDLRRVRYPHYRRLGVWLLLLELWALVVLTAVATVVWRAAPGMQARGAAYWLAAVLACLLLSIALARVRRRRALDAVWAQVTDVMGNANPAPHVIAHSLGSYLFARLLAERRALMRTDQVIFTGSVLDTQWDWARIKSVNAAAFRHVRNDWSPDDVAARHAKLLWRFVPHFGSAGSTGFREGEHVHSKSDPFAACARCTAEAKALVHNVCCEGYEHGSALVSSGHAARFWLPQLLKFEQHEYDLLLEQCALHGELARDGHVRETWVVFEEIASLPRPWLHGADLRSYFENLVDEHRRPRGSGRSALVNACLFCFVRTLDRGCDEADATDDPSGAFQPCLNPFRAARCPSTDCTAPPRWGRLAHALPARVAARGGGDLPLAARPARCLRGLEPGSVPAPAAACGLRQAG